MKTNKLLNWLYAFLMGLPIIVTLFYMLAMVFTRNPNFQFSYDSFVNAFEDIMYQGRFDFVENNGLYGTINDFLSYFGISGSLGLDYLFTYWLTISIVWLGFEVLMTFIQMARKLIYAFVDKEF